MCGRFGLTDPQAVQGFLEIVRVAKLGDGVDDLLVPRYNIAPSQPVVAVRTRVPGRSERGGPERRADVFRWGLIPSWATDSNIGNALANARAETVAEKPSFRGAWKAGRRCLVPADAFYEWQDLSDAEADPRNGDPGTTGRRPVARSPKPPKQPYAIRMQDDAPFAFGGLWEAWRDPAREPDEAEAWVPTCTLITTAPNRLMARLHDRMPVIVPRAAYDAWLDPALPLDAARAMLAPYAPEAMRAYPVSRYVNSPQHDDPHVLDPLPPEAPEAEPTAAT